MSRWSVLGFLLLVACGSPSSSSTTPANRSATEAAEGVQYVGNPTASVALTYYFDYECPHCYATAPLLDDIVRKYADRIVVHYKNFQMAKHPDARRAAIAAEAARRQGKYIEMHRALMKHAEAVSHARSDEEMIAALQDGRDPPSTFPVKLLRELAGTLGLDLERYDRDVNDPSAGARVDAEYAEGEKQGVEYVPVMYVGATRYEGDLEALPATLDAKLTP